MKNIGILLIVLLCGGIITAQRTESPYLQILTKNAIIPLKSSKANVDIIGKIAHVTISQVYQNTGKSPIEAKYVFPMSLHAAVHDMKMKIDDRLISAIVYEKKKANKVYKKAIKEGKRASKLEQSRPNVFQMNVGNIMPQDEVEIIISYTEMVSVKNGGYQFVLPGTVGPRFTGEKKNNKETVFKTPYTPKGSADTFDFDLALHIEAGLILQKVFTNTHEIAVHYPDATSAEIKLTDENSPGNRDFILNYTTRGKDIQGGLLLYEGKEENFFAFQIEPPKQISRSSIPPREYLFVVDVSGSMMGYPIEVAKSLMQNLLTNLREEDSFNVILFSADHKVFEEQSVIASETNIKRAFQFLSGQFNNYGGGTRLLKALQKAYDMPAKEVGSSRTVVVITDGFVNVEKETFELISNNLNKGNVTTFGIGSSVNRYLIEGMSRMGRSLSFIATNKNDAYKVAEKFRQYIASPLLTQIEIKTDNIELYDVTPKSIPDVFSERPITIFGKYKGNMRGSLTVSGYLGPQKVSKTFLVKNGKLSKRNTALKYLWARNKIQELGDYSKAFGSNESIKKEITALGIQYNLATQYTSFVAVDVVSVNKNGKMTKVNQPIALPKNVNNSAVGAAAEVKGKSVYAKRFTISMEGVTENSTIRNIKLWLTGRYSKVIKNWLTTGNQVRIIADKMGKIVAIEIDQNGTWKKVYALKPGLYHLPSHIQLKNELTILIKKNPILIHNLKTN